MVASAIGNPLQVDSGTAGKSRLSVARVCIEIDITGTRKESIHICVDGEIFEQKVVYEVIPKYCSDCHHLGHLVSECYVNGNAPRSKPRAVPAMAGFQNSKGVQRNTTTKENSVPQPSPLSATVQEIGLVPNSNQFAVLEEGEVFASPPTVRDKGKSPTHISPILSPALLSEMSVGGAVEVLEGCLENPSITENSSSMRGCAFDDGSMDSANEAVDLVGFPQSANKAGCANADKVFDELPNRPLAKDLSISDGTVPIFEQHTSLLEDIGVFNLCCSPILFASTTGFVDDHLVHEHVLETDAMDPDTDTAQPSTESNPLKLKPLMELQPVCSINRQPSASGASPLRSRQQEEQFPNTSVPWLDDTSIATNSATEIEQVEQKKQALHKRSSSVLAKGLCLAKIDTTKTYQRSGRTRGQSKGSKQTPR